MEERDRKLWRLAQKRAGFKKNLMCYAVANIFFWVIWYMTTKGTYSGLWPWPVWITVFWGIGIIYNYAEAYHIVSPIRWAVVLNRQMNKKHTFVQVRQSRFGYPFCKIKREATQTHNDLLFCCLPFYFTPPHHFVFIFNCKFN